MEISDVFSGSTLKAADLKGKEPTVTISNVEMKKFDNGNKLVVSFEGAQKSLVCNKTNANRIALAHGTNTDNWIGQSITLYTDMVDFQGDLVEAIRVKIRKPVQQERPAGGATTPPRRQTGGISDVSMDRDMDQDIPF